MRRPRLPGLALLAALAGPLATLACGGSRPIALAQPFKPGRAVEAEEAWQAFDSYCDGVRSFSASGELEVRDLRSARSRRFGARLVAARPGRLYVKASVAVVTALEVVADGQRFWFQVPSKKTVWTGLSTATPRPAAEDAPYEALRPGDVVAALLPEKLERLEGLLWESDPRSVALSQLEDRDGGLVVRRRVELDRDSLLPSRLLFYDSAGDLLTEVVLSDWKEETPRRVLLKRREGYEALLVFDKAGKNGSAPERLFEPRLPQGYQTVEVTS